MDQRKLAPPAGRRVKVPRGDRGAQIFQPCSLSVETGGSSSYESQKQRDWNSYCQYLKNQKPPISLSHCSGAHVIEFLKYLDQFGKTKVHISGCPYFGQPDPRPSPCTCPLRQAWGSLDALVGRLRAAYEEKFGSPESNPFSESSVRNFLREVREHQSKARGILYQKKQKRPQRLTSSSVSKLASRHFVGTREIKAYEDMLKCIKMVLGLSERVEDLLLVAEDEVSLECLDCLVYCSLFPKDYELESDMLVQLWMAAGLVSEEDSDHQEHIAAAYFRALHFREIVSFSREDRGTGKTWYRVNGFILPEKVLKMSSIIPSRHHFIMTQHVCQTTGYLEGPGRFTELRTFLFLRRGHNCYKSSNVDHSHFDFFMSLEHLRVLDLSGTKLSKLPSSVGNARCLRYLDLSDTLIRRLPETMDALQSLQTLKLRNCPRLLALPKGTKNLINLRHLDLGPLCCLRSMPPGVGALTNLRTLSSFVVGRQEYRCGLGELKHIDNLRGKLCLSRLEHVVSIDEAKEANLSYKQFLTNLELRWNDVDVERESTEVDDHEIVEHLRPHTNLRELRILCYQGSEFPSWISHPCFDKLLSITLFKCEYCSILPTLGQLPSLECLSFIELVGVRTIDFRFCGDITERDYVVGFPKLQKLVIKSMVNLEEWRGMGQNDFPCLKKLVIQDCPKLGALCKISNLHSLEYLEINRCAELPSLPEGDLPPLKMLVIEACPLLS